MANNTQLSGYRECHGELVPLDRDHFYFYSTGRAHARCKECVRAERRAERTLAIDVVKLASGYSMTCKECGERFENKEPRRYCGRVCKGLARTAASFIDVPCVDCGDMVNRQRGGLTRSTTRGQPTLCVRCKQYRRASPILTDSSRLCRGPVCIHASPTGKGIVHLRDAWRNWDLDAYCRTCMNLNERVRSHRAYITTQELLDAIDNQRGKCANLSCDRTVSVLDKSTVIDHCHSTQSFRGVLCAQCNFALGHAYDSPKLLRGLADYLERKRRPPVSGEPPSR